MITEKLVECLRDRFPNIPMKFGRPPEPSVVIPGVHPDVGDIQILDEGSEVILIAGNFTHGHFSDFDSESTDEAEKTIVEEVASFLERMFNDQIVMWAVPGVAGGWYDRDRESETMPTLDALQRGSPRFVWSGPLNQ